MVSDDGYRSEYLGCKRKIEKGETMYYSHWGWDERYDSFLVRGYTYYCWSGFKNVDHPAIRPPGHCDVMCEDCMVKYGLKW